MGIWAPMEQVASVWQALWRAETAKHDFNISTKAVFTDKKNLWVKHFQL